MHQWERKRTDLIALNFLRWKESWSFHLKLLANSLVSPAWKYTYPGLLSFLGFQLAVFVYFRWLKHSRSLGRHQKRNRWSPKWDYLGAEKSKVENGCIDISGWQRSEIRCAPCKTSLTHRCVPQGLVFDILAVQQLLYRQVMKVFAGYTTASLPPGFGSYSLLYRRFCITKSQS